jgi:hypothetical protein
MTIRTIPRKTVGGSIKVARLPLDLAVSMMPGNGDGPAASATVALDRVEAQHRDLARIALRDDVLREDAGRRRVAAYVRVRALRLRSAAQRRAAEADERLAEAQDTAEETREQAAERARRERSKAATERRRRTQEAAKAERKLKADNAELTNEIDAAIDERATDARLEQLEHEAEALDRKEAALTAEAEAQRLQDEATKKKAARKRRATA